MRTFSRPTFPFALLCGLLLALSSAALAQDTRQNLAGAWRFALDRADAGEQGVKQALRSIGAQEPQGRDRP